MSRTLRAWIFWAVPLIVLAARPVAAQPASESWKDQGILNVTRSPHAKLHSVPIRAVTINQGFWAERRKTNLEKSIPTMREVLLTNGRMENFRRLTGKSKAAQNGPVYADAHVYKWLEAVGFALQSGNVPDLRKATDDIINDVVAVQEPGGYLNTYFVGDRASQRMLPATQSTGHELYNIGHLLQAGIAYYRATGDRKMLDAATRFFDDFIIKSYGPEPSKKPLVSGHPGTELALIELYRITGEKRYLNLAGYLLHGDPERMPFPQSRYVYMFCGIPFTSRTQLEGHAVRAMYAASGATDYYIETGDQAYWKTLETLWNDLTKTKMYITGGVGARSSGESFGDPYELPNSRAYGESCAAIGNMMWNWRMLVATGEARFTDVVERVLYNGINSGMSLNGTTFCYRNPLEYDPESGPIRNAWYTTNCCPSNIQRIFSALPGYLYSTSSDGIYVHLYQNSELDWRLENGTGLKVSQHTNYPWDGNVDMTVTPAQPSEFTFYVRIPAWSTTTRVTVNGQAVSGAKPGAYLPVKRRWAAGDQIQVQFNMTPQVLSANPQLADDSGRVAIQRGPLVYCLEQLDQKGVASLSDVAVVLGRNPGSEFRPEFQRDLLGGITVLRHEGALTQKKLSEEPLYQLFEPLSQQSTHPTTLTLIPYYAWANREPSAMQLWIRYIQR
jgi:uncharacterized protein